MPSDDAAAAKRQRTFSQPTREAEKAEINKKAKANRGGAVSHWTEIV